MSSIEKPYFMENKKWFTFNQETGKIELTKEAPPKAVESYNAFYRLWKDTMFGDVPPLLEE